MQHLQKQGGGVQCSPLVVPSDWYVAAIYLLCLPLLRKRPGVYQQFPFWNSSPRQRSSSQSAQPRKSRSVAGGPFEASDDLPHGTIPENRSRRVFPLRVGCEEDGLVPEKSFVLAAKRFWLSRLGHPDPAQFQRDKMFRIPELPNA